MEFMLLGNCYQVIIDRRLLCYIYIYLLCFLERFAYNSHLIAIILKIMLISLMKIIVIDESS